MSNTFIQDGKVQNTSVSNMSLSNTNNKSGSTLGKEDFLTLLVAQMKYQDPLEPTSNTEYISQLATFSSLEEMQNLNASMDTNLASSLVGKTVIMRVTSEATGQVYYETGKVDMVVKENGKIYLSINDNYYSIDDLDTVLEDDYFEAVGLAETFKVMVASLPNANNLTISDREKVEAVRKAYDSMTSYQKQFVEKDVYELFEKAETRMDELVVRDFSAKVTAIPDVDDLKASDKETVEAARKAYDGMNDAQKKKVTKEVLETLEEAEAKIKELTSESDSKK